MNQKDLRIKKLYDKGMRRPADIARKIGYNSGTLQEGVTRVIEGLGRCGVTIKQPNPTEMMTTYADS